jgi:hypothetical protein
MLLFLLLLPSSELPFHTLILHNCFWPSKNFNSNGICCKAYHDDLESAALQLLRILLLLLHAAASDMIMSQPDPIILRHPYICGLPEYATKDQAPTLNSKEPVDLLQSSAKSRLSIDLRSLAASMKSSKHPSFLLLQPSCMAISLL